MYALLIFMFTGKTVLVTVLELVNGFSKANRKKTLKYTLGGPLCYLL